MRQTEVTVRSTVTRSALPTVPTGLTDCLIVPASRKPSNKRALRFLCQRIGLVRATVDDRDIVRGVNFELGRGRVVGIVGESGSGKTLTCRSVLGLLPAGCDVAGLIIAATEG